MSDESPPHPGIGVGRGLITHHSSLDLEVRGGTVEGDRALDFERGEGRELAGGAEGGHGRQGRELAEAGEGDRTGSLDAAEAGRAAAAGDGGDRAARAATPTPARADRERGGGGGAAVLATGGEDVGTGRRD